MKLILAAMIVASAANAATMYTIVDLGLVNPGAPPPMNYSNGVGQSVGGNGHAYEVNGGIVTDLGVLPGGSWSAAYGINGSGSAVGFSDTAIAGQFLGFIWTPSSGMSPLSTLAGLDSWAMAINDPGFVAGSSIASSGFIHAVMWANGQIYDLGTLGGTSSSASGINNSGTIVGTADVGDGDHAFIYSNGVMTDLNALIPGSLGWILNSGSAIDNQGDITGIGAYQGAQHIFELQPTGGVQSLEPLAAPEPSTFVSIGILIALAASRATIKARWKRSPKRTRNGSRI